MTIRVLIPKMPDPDELAPYLRRMHGRRVYVNNGPLVIQMEERLQSAIGLPCRMVSNGTVALQLALQAMRLRTGQRVAVPAVTFSGSALAIQNAGLTPVLVDVDPLTWHMTPAQLSSVDCDAAMPVAAFGMPVDIGPWVAWATAMNKPVIVDAAGCLLDQPIAEHRLVAFVYSLHATKFIGAGEGGAIASVSMSVLDRVADLARFGLYGGTNAKMSEYHAAVAHASLDTAEERALVLWGLRTRYISRLLRLLPSALLQRPAIEMQWRGSPSMLPILLPADRLALPTMMALGERGIETKQWYRAFLNERDDMPASVVPLPMTQMLIERFTGLPFHQHLTIDEVDAVCTHLGAICASL